MLWEEGCDKVKTAEPDYFFDDHESPEEGGRGGGFRKVWEHLPRGLTYLMGIRERSGYICTIEEEPRFKGRQKMTRKEQDALNHDVLLPCSLLILSLSSPFMPRKSWITLLKSKSEGEKGLDDPLSFSSLIRGL